MGFSNVAVCGVYYVFDVAVLTSIHIITVVCACMCMYVKLHNLSYLLNHSR